MHLENTRLGLPCICLIICTIVCTAQVDAAPFFEKQIILRRDIGSEAIAIPKILVTRGGTAIVVAQRREGGDWGKRIDPIGIRSTDGGRTWSEPFLLIPEGFPRRDDSLMKPTGIVVDHKNNRVLTFISRSPLRNRENKPVYERWFYSHLQETRRLGRAWFLVYSDDDGQTWTEPREITGQLIKKPHWQEWSPVHSGTQLRFGPHKGRLVVPVRCYCPETDPSPYTPEHQYNGVIYSDDGGTTWMPGGRSESRLGECALVERSDGSLYVNHRTSRIASREAERMHNVSTDGGVTFTSCTSSGLTDARCHAGLTALTEPSGQRLLLLTNVPGPERTGLTISISNDEGNTWTPKRVIEPGHSAYSDLAVLPDRTILCVYETGENTSRRHLAVARFNLAWILEMRTETASNKPDAANGN